MVPSKLLMVLPGCLQSMTSLIGMLLSLLACSMALVVSSTDQTGQRLAELSRAFQSSLSRHGIGTDRSSADSDHVLTFHDPEPGNRPVRGNRPVAGIVSDLRFPGRTPIDSDENEFGLLLDVKEPVFLNFLSELQRFCRVSAVDNFDGELAIDLLWSSAKSDEEIVSRVCDVIRSVEYPAEGFQCEYQLTVWAASPVRSAFVDAAQQASKIQFLVQEHQSSRWPAPLRLSSSGQIWSSREAIRPAVTIVIRRIRLHGYE